MKFKVGDKVRLKNDLEIGKKYGYMTFQYGMNTEEILIVQSVGSNGNVYAKGWYYSPEMLEKLPVSHIENGRFCRDRNGDIYVWLFGQMFANDEILAEICFNDDLTSQSCRDCDIMEIRQPIPGLAFNINELFENFDKMELIWKREPEAKDKAIEMLNDVISDCEKSIKENKSMIENARQTIRKIEEGDLDALLHE